MSSRTGRRAIVTVASATFDLREAQSDSQERPISEAAKRGVDVSIAVVALAILLPILLITAFLVWCNDRKSPFFGHLRLGRHGRMFRCWKFRSMQPDASEVLSAYLAANPAAALEWAATQKLRDDPRITPIGRVLRLTSLDELPQLWNVVIGQMSLVGPRPIVLDEVDRYGAQIRYYLMCRPGLTGLWQISGRSDTSYAERVRFDAHYAQSWSVWRDVSIVLRTVPILLSRRGSY